MGAGSVLSPYNLRPPYSPSPLVDPATGQATNPMDLYLRNLTTIIAGLAGYSTQYYGAPTNGTDAQPAFQAAINDIVNAGGGTLVIGTATYTLMAPVVIPATDRKGNPTGPISIVGQGESSVILRGANMPPGMGMLDVSSSGFSMKYLVADGDTLVPAGLQYNVDFNTPMENNDPMAPVLTTNTSIWFHGPMADLSLTSVQIRHTGGYSVLVDCMPGTIQGVNFVQCQLFANHPNAFGTTLGQLIFGSWGGGIFINGDGRTAGSGVLQGLLMDTCQFYRNNGNCVWSHSYGFQELHTDFRIIGNYFEDCGLDAVEIGGVSGGIVGFNVFRRIGYTTFDDTTQSVPRWLNLLNATAIDSSGLVKGVSYVCNTMCSVNGGFIDLDGHCDSSISGNMCRIPLLGEPEFAEDQTQITGLNNNGSTSYGINMNNSANTAWGAQNVTISANQFINIPEGSIRLYAARNCIVESNGIIAPANSAYPPVGMGPVGAGPYQRCYGNRISHNKFDYSPAGSVPTIFEDSTYSAFLATESNSVFGNCPITPTGTLAYEFLASVNSGSVVFQNQVWFLSAIPVENGSNNAIATPARYGPPLTLGLTVQVLLSHTLQAGGNTYAYGGGSAQPIKSHFNPANNLATAYAVGGLITLLWSGTAWLDLSL